MYYESQFLNNNTEVTILDIINKIKNINIIKNNNSNSHSENLPQVMSKQAIDCLQYIMALPLILIIVVMPFVMQLVFVKTDFSKYPWHSDSEKMADIFLYKRADFMIMTVGIMLIILMIYMLFGIIDIGIFLRKEFIFMLIFAMVAIASGTAAENRPAVFRGTPEQYEGLPVVLGYLVIFIYAYAFVSKYKNMKIIMYSFAFSTMILCIIGLMQYMGADIFNTEFGKKLIVPDNYAEYRERLNFKFSSSDVNRVYMTLYNPNYVGVYTSMAIWLLAGMIAIERKKWIRVWMLIIEAMCIFNMMASGSKAALISNIFGIVILIVFNCIKNKKIKWQYLTVMVMILLTVFLYDTFTKDGYIASLKKGINFTKKNYKLENITSDKDGINIFYNGKNIKITLNDGNIRVSDMNDNSTKLMEYEDDGSYRLLNKRLKDISVKYNKDFIKIIINKTEWKFDISNGDYKYINAYKKEDILKKAEHTGFDGYEKILTNRGYIWSRTLPLLKDKWFTGSGADTFVYEFPQNDYVMKSNVMSVNSLITRPHNLYLQIWVQNGFIALASFLSLCITYIFRVQKNYVKGIASKWDISICMTVICYLFVCLTNDSMIVTAPVFWLALGMGMAEADKAVNI